MQPNDELGTSEPMKNIDKTPANNMPPKPEKKKKLPMIICIIATILLVAAVALFICDRYFVQKDSDKKTEETAETTEDEIRDYNEVYDKLSESDVAKWNETQLNDTYDILVAADEAGNFTMVYNTLSLLEAAASNGIDIDNNNRNIGQEERNQMMARASEAENAAFEAAPAEEAN